VIFIADPDQRVVNLGERRALSRLSQLLRGLELERCLAASGAVQYERASPCAARPSRFFQRIRQLEGECLLSSGIVTARNGDFAAHHAQRQTSSLARAPWRFRHRR
jgi:hypothetical protein